MNKIATLNQFFKFFLLGWLLFPLASYGTTVLQVGVRDLTDKSEFIFEGEVLSSKAYIGQNGMIKTRVTFNVADIVKGKHGASTIELDFLGGTFNGKTLNVGEMKVPAIGEAGVYFVETKSNKQIHPFYGWSQGHFLLKRDTSGVDRVTTNSSRPVTGLKGEKSSNSKIKFSHGVAHGIQYSTNDDLASALSATEFKSRLKDLLKGEN